MIKKLVIIFTLCLIFIKCSVDHSKLIAEGNYEVAIQNAIIDFTKTSLFKKSNVFKLNVQYPNDDVILITIIEDENNKYLFSDNSPIDENVLPSRYIEKDGKLFIWWDNQYKINHESFNILSKYNMLVSDEGGMIKYLDDEIDDKLKGADYFFCKNNLRIYKRVITNIAIVSVPRLKCK